MSMVRRPRWSTPPPPPTPRILNLPQRFPLRIRRKRRPARNAASKPHYGPEPAAPGRANKGDPKSIMFEQTNHMSRAECKCLRIEKEIDTRTLERESGFAERRMESAVLGTLQGEKKPVSEDGRSNIALQEEIKELARKIVEVKRCSKKQDDAELRGCSNFDKRVVMLQRKLEKLDCLENEKPLREAMEMAKAGTTPNTGCKEERTEVPYSMEKHNRVSDVERLRREMEQSSKGKLKKMEEEFGRMFYTAANSSAANSSAASSASTSQLYEDPKLPSILPRRRQKLQEAKSGDTRTCSGHCKAIVKKIMEQVRADTEHWTQMQGMLGQVRAEIEELQASRDFWEQRALRSDLEIQSLRASVQEWRKRAISLQMEENKLQEQGEVLQRELDSLRREQEREYEARTVKELMPVSHQTTSLSHDKENRALTCRVKSTQPSQNGREKIDGSLDRPRNLNHGCSSLPPVNRPPLRDIRNLSPLASQNNKRSTLPFNQLF